MTLFGSAMNRLVTAASAVVLVACAALRGLNLGEGGSDAYTAGSILGAIIGPLFLATMARLLYINIRPGPVWSPGLLATAAAIAALLLLFRVSF